MYFTDAAIQALKLKMNSMESITEWDLFYNDTSNYKYRDNSLCRSIIFKTQSRLNKIRKEEVKQLNQNNYGN